MVPTAASAAPAPDSQIVAGNAFMSNGYIELGSRPNGSFGSDTDAPAGYHPLTTGSRQVLGFRADRDKDGWGVGTDDGDFFTPGIPWEAWALAVGDGPWRENSSSVTGVPGAHASPETGPGGASGTWEADAPVDGIHLTQVVTIPAGSRLLNVDVTLTNTTGDVLNNVRYLRTVDPDNCAMRTEPVCDTDGDGAADGAAWYATWNTVVAQKAAGDARSIVSADQTDGSYLDLRTAAAGSSVGFCTGFSVSRCASDSPVGERKFADDAFYLRVDTPTLAAGASRTFRFQYVLAEDEAVLPPAAEPTVGTVKTRPRAVLGNAGKVPATCRTKGADLARCKIVLTTRSNGERVVLGKKARSFASADVRRGVVKVPLNRRGKALLNRLGGVDVKVTGVVRAVGSSKPVTRKDRIRLLPRTVSLSPVMFGAKTSQVEHPYRGYLNGVAQRLRHVKLIRITGHTDNQGTPAYNMRLGLDRAKAVRAILDSGQGTRPRFRLESRGEHAPVASNATKEGRAQNRRAVIVIRY
ncbi:OmpA family protein [Nocardioides coralli]|uniref:OmpA family protein n=1 Tax=Nocardioides coralli TaxID=2872154 RepID=UPI001CA41EC4|nr:OmpA family protein [Nocardioides coralli]QZY28349.1 OmpA family protein [Nocardioides coralli]